MNTTRTGVVFDVGFRATCVPASLEGVIGDLEIEVNEGEKNLEFDKEWCNA